MINKSILFASLFLIFPDSNVRAATKVPTAICANNSSGSISLRFKCKRVETKIANRTSLVGPQGTAGSNGTNGINGSNGAAGTNGTNGNDGSPGADGALRIYGDGSAGALNILSSTNWLNNPPSNNNLQFSTCAIAASTTLTVPSGTVIRCSSTATIAGTIFVLPAPNGATVKRSGSASLLIAPAYQAPTAVSGFSAAAAGELSLLGSGTIAGGDGGAAVSSISGTTAGLQFFSLLFRGSNITGGGGAASIGLNTSGFGGGGGGSFALIAKQTISLTGTLNVVGGSTSSPGAGGGSGGFAVLASGQSVTVTGSGVISAVGTNGGNSDASVGAGGGGGGGIIQIIAPTVPAQITIDGFTDIEGGSAGSIAVNQSSANIRQAGSGGGGLGGEGGDGGIVSSAAGTQSPSSASAGLPGFASAIAADPAALLLY